MKFVLQNKHCFNNVRTLCQKLVLPGLSNTTHMIDHKIDCVILLTVNESPPFSNSKLKFKSFSNSKLTDFLERKFWYKNLLLSDVTHVTNLYLTSDPK